MTPKNDAMKPMIDQSTKNEVEVKELEIIDNENNSQVDKPITELQPAAQKTRFRQNFENGMTVEEARKDTIDHIKQLYAKDSQIEVQPVIEKTKFRQDFEKAISIGESKSRMVEHIYKYYENKE